MKIVTVDQLLPVLEELAAESPDWVDSGIRFPGSRKHVFVYTNEGEPACIIGHALKKLGFFIFEMERFDIDGLFNSGLDCAALELAFAVQDWQDKRIPWCRAVKYAKAGKKAK